MTATKRDDATRLRSRKGRYAAECDYCGCPVGCACKGDCPCGSIKPAGEQLVARGVVGPATLRERATKKKKRAKHAPCARCGKRIELGADAARRAGVEQGATLPCDGRTRDDGGEFWFHPTCAREDKAERERETAPNTGAPAQAPKKRSGPNIPEMDRRTVAMKLRLPRAAADALHELALRNGATLSATVADLASEVGATMLREEHEAIVAELRAVIASLTPKKKTPRS